MVEAGGQPANVIVPGKRIHRCTFAETLRMEATINKKETFAEIINGDTLVLVDFSAEWCGPCKIMNPVLEELHQRMGDKVRILKIDIDKSPAQAQAWQVESVPTLILFQKGKSLWRRSGVPLALQLEKVIRSFIISEQ